MAANTAICSSLERLACRRDTAQTEILSLFESCVIPEGSQTKRGDIGFHFGNKRQAQTRVGKRGTVGSYYLNITNPWIVTTDFGSWEGDYIASRFLNGYSYSDEPYNVFKSEGDIDRLKQIAKMPTTKANQEFKRLLIDKGYDGVRYENHHEGSGYSYIAFRPEQIKSTSNLFPTDESDFRASLMQLEDGTKFVQIDQNQDRFEGKDESEYPRIAKQIMREKFRGRVIGIENRAFVTGEGVGEYTHSRKRLYGQAYIDKMRASSELNNLIEAGRNFRNDNDGMDGHEHPEAVGGFDKYDTLFKIDGRWYEGIVNIMVTERGKQFKDVTKIKDVTKDILDQYGENPQAQFLSTSSMNNISKNQEDVNNNLRSSLLDLDKHPNARDLGLRAVQFQRGLKLATTA